MAISVWANLPPQPRYPESKDLTIFLSPVLRPETASAQK